MSPTIRKATAADESALSRICLLTADAGKSAEALHDHKELPGLVYSVPYVHLPTTYAFVLVDGDVVVGYIVGSKDTRAYEQHAEEDWWPKHAERFPPNAMVREADKEIRSDAAEDANGRPGQDRLLSGAFTHKHP
ncbi:N-acetyltransferase domain-containing protein [Mycena kentingensis (nom. inval.)]|nr:N-acetyltransferase domain-containing protein [Mycena kentingensis (nom. inval.)]